MKEEIVYEQTLPARQPFVRRISWAAIFAGIIITFVVELVLSILGVSIGATTVNPLSEQNPAGGLGIGAGIWLAVSSIIAIFLGGWVAGRMSGFTREGALHGLITWGATTLLTLLLLTTAAGKILGGAGSLIGGAMQTAGQKVSSSDEGSQGAMGAVNSAISGISGGKSDSVRQEVQSVTENSTPEEKAKLTAAVGKMLKSNGAPEDKQAVTQMLVSQNQMSEQEANQKVDQWMQTYQQTKSEVSQKARVVGEKTAKGVSIAGWSAFGMLVLGALAAAFGGSRGARSYYHGRVFEAPVAA